MSSADQYEVLQRLAYQAWLDRGQPTGSPEIDWSRAEAMVEEQREAATRMNAITQARQADAPVLSDAIAVTRKPMPKPQRRLKTKAADLVASSETPLEVPPTSPAPPPPTPTQAAAIA